MWVRTRAALARSLMVCGQAVTCWRTRQRWVSRAKPRSPRARSRAEQQVVGAAVDVEPLAGVRRQELECACPGQRRCSRRRRGWADRGRRPRTARRARARGRRSGRGWRRVRPRIPRGEARPGASPRGWRRQTGAPCRPTRPRCGNRCDSWWAPSTGRRAARCRPGSRATSRRRRPARGHRTAAARRRPAPRGPPRRTGRQ